MSDSGNSSSSGCGGAGASSGKRDTLETNNDTPDNKDVVKQHSVSNNLNNDNNQQQLSEPVQSIEGHQPSDEIFMNTKSSRPIASSSSPIDIKQASCGKFGVFQARPPPGVSPSQGLMIDQSTGEPVQIDKLIKTANTMSSMLMAHKIALEDDFRLEPGMDISGPLMSLSPIIGSSPFKAGAGSGQQEPSLHSRVKDIVHEAYWDVFREELGSQKSDKVEERKYDVSKQLLCDIRQKILELLLPQHNRLKQDVEDKLDSKIIDQLTRVHSFNLIDYGHYILSMLSKLCAPVRDEKLKELSETNDIVQLYRGIMELLELMRLDFANFTLNQFKPHIKAHSQDYEREKFNEILKQQKTIGIDGLEYTRVWLSRAVERVDAIHGISELVNDTSSDQQVTLESELEIELGKNVTSSGTPVATSKQERINGSDIVNKVLNAAYCELLEWTPQTQKMYPETLLFDEATFKQLSEQYKVLLLTASILLTTFAFVNRLKIQESNEFKVLVKSHIITLLTATYDSINQPPSTTITANDANCNNHPASSFSSSSAAAAPPSSSSSSSSSPVNQPPVNQSLYSSQMDELDCIKLETVATKLCDDIRQKIQETNATLLDSFESQQDSLKRQILDLLSSSNRVRELARRRILVFVETLLDLDVKHQQKKFPTKMPPPVNIPLGLNCLTDEITLTMAQLVKIIRYNRRVFFQHYQDIIIEQVSKYV